jgi:hypothetical protein
LEGITRSYQNWTLLLQNVTLNFFSITWVYLSSPSLESSWCVLLGEGCLDRYK